MEGTLVILQPTPFCNIDCKYCYLPNRNVTKRMSIEMLEKIISGLMRSKSVMDPIEITYHAGEPLAVPKEFYIRASELLQKYGQTYGRPAMQYLQTNATLIDAEWTEIFRLHDIKVGVSIDGPQFIHDHNRVTRQKQPTHQKVMKGVDFLRQAGLDFPVIMVLTKFALDYPDEIYEFFIENRIHRVGFNIDEFGANPYTSSYAGVDSWNETIEKYKRFMHRLMELIDKDNNRLVVREFAKIASIVAKDAAGEGEMLNGSNSPMYILNFDVNGNYTTFSPELLSAKSPQYDNFFMGNILNQEIDEIFNNEKFKRVQQEINEGVVACKQSCQYWGFCGGGHPADKLYELGQFNTTETLNCRVHTKTLVDVMLEHLQSRFSYQI